MKKYMFLSLALLCATPFSQAQIKAALSGGYAVPTGSISESSKGAFNMTAEIGYVINKKMEAGIMWEGIFFGTVDLSVDGAAVKYTFTVNSLLASGRYYFTTGNKFRPYGQLGIGTALVSLNLEGSLLGTTLSIPISTSLFAIRPAIGMQYGIFNFNVAYITMGDVKSVATNPSSLTINAGLSYVFGKRKNKS